MRWQPQDPNTPPYVPSPSPPALGNQFPVYELWKRHSNYTGVHILWLCSYLRILLKLKIIFKIFGFKDCDKIRIRKHQKCGGVSKLYWDICRAQDVNFENH